MLIDGNTLLLFMEIMSKQGWLELPSSGNSMYPIIKQGDICRFASCSPFRLKKGDVVLYCTPAGQLIAHRLYSVVTIENQTRFLFKGDTNLGFDEPVDDSQIVGKLSIIYRKKRKVRLNGVVPTLWGRLILSCPWFSGVLRRYLNSRLYPQF